MAHEDYYYKYGDHMPDGTPDTRWHHAPTRWLNRGHDAAVDGALGVLKAGRAVKDFVGNTTFNPLPYGDMANSAYEGIQNSYGGWLDDKYDAVADWYNPQPDMMTGGPMSRNGYRHHSGVPVPLDEYPSSHANPHLLSSDFPTQQAYDDAVAEGHLANKEYNIMRSGMDYPVDDYNNREYNIMRHGVDYPVDNRSDWQKWKDSVSGGY